MKTNFKIILLIISNIILYSAASISPMRGQESEKGLLTSISRHLSNQMWLELEGYHTYHSNDFYIKNYKDYGISKSITRFGVRTFNLNSILVFEPYINGNLVYDIFDQSWNRVDWHNNYVYGVGCRLRFILKGISWVNQNLHAQEFNLDFFVEKLWIGYIKETEFYTGHRPQNDLKLGMRYWLDIGNKKVVNKDGFYNGLLNICWLESAANFHYSKSSFYVKSQQNFYLLTMLNKLGIRIRTTNHIFFEPYFKNHLVYDFGKKSWNHLDWQNNIQYGFGIRYKYYHQPEYKKGMTNLIIGPYFEYLGIKYWNKVPYIPIYRPSFDYRVGIEVWFSINGKEI